MAAMQERGPVCSSTFSAWSCLLHPTDPKKPHGQSWNTAKSDNKDHGCMKQERIEAIYYYHKRNKDIKYITGQIGTLNIACFLHLFPIPKQR